MMDKLKKIGKWIKTITFDVAFFGLMILAAIKNQEWAMNIVQALVAIGMVLTLMMAIVEHAPDQEQSAEVLKRKKSYLIRGCGTRYDRITDFIVIMFMSAYGWWGLVVMTFITMFMKAAIRANVLQYCVKYDTEPS